VDPRLVYADLTGYGEKGPTLAFRIRHHAYWARSGLLSLTRDAVRHPLPRRAVEIRDGVTLFSAIVTALYRRERTGKGPTLRHRFSRRSLVLRRFRSGRTLRRHVLPCMIG